MTKIIRVLIADDETAVRQELCALLETEEGIEVLAEASDDVEAVRKAKNFIPDILLLDLTMPHKTGVEALAEVQREVPHTRVIVLISPHEDDKVFAAIKAGARGYVHKERASTELAYAIRGVYYGHPPLLPTVARKMIRELNRPTTLPPMDEPLTDREAEVLILVARGLAIADIARKLIISEQTVNTHLYSILNKVGELG